MAPLEQESNVHVLREYAVLATRETKRLQSLVDNLNRLLRAQNQTWLKDDGSESDLSDQLSRLQKKFYGFGRESLEGDRPIGHSDQQLKLHGERPHESKTVGPAEGDKKVVAQAVPPAVIEYPMSDADLKEEGMSAA